MKKAQITFEVTEDKTIATATGTKGNVDIIDITGTEIEEKLVSLLRELHELKQERQILDAIDIAKYQPIH